MFRIFAIILTLLLSPSAYATDEVNCGVQLTDLRVEGNSNVTVHNVGCTGRRQQLNVRYVWVNLNTAAFVLDGNIPQELHPVFGRNGAVVSTTVGRDVDLIVSRYGATEQGHNNRPFPGHYIPDSTSAMVLGASGPSRLELESLMGQRRERRSPSRSETIRYVPLEPFPWPDLGLVGGFTAGARWPSGRYFYSTGRMSFSQLRAELRAPRSDRTARDATLDCISPYRLVSADEFNQYWFLVDRAADRIEAQGLQRERLLPDIYNQEFDYTVRAVRAGHPSYDALEYFARDGWPADYLLAVGNYTTLPKCGDHLGGFSYNAIPRQPFVLFAVVGTDGDQLSVEGLNFLVDGEKQLRRTVNAGQPQSIDFASQVLVSSEAPLLIPLRVELRYDLDEMPFAGIVGRSDEPLEIYRLLLRHGPEFVSDDGEYAAGAGGFRKRVDELPRPSTMDITRRYFYGRALELSSVELQNDTIAVKSAPAAAVITTRYFSVGSCPFVSFLDRDGQLLFRERILVGASSAEQARTETLDIPATAAVMRIEEVEPEISHLASVAFHNADGTSQVVAQDLTLNPRQGIEVPFPSEGTARATRVSFSGYYQPL